MCCADKNALADSLLSEAADSGKAVGKVYPMPICFFCSVLFFHNLYVADFSTNFSPLDSVWQLIFLQAMTVPIS